MQVVAEMHINVNGVLKNHGLQDEGPVQKYIDEQCIERMEEYTPFESGDLMRSVRANTKIGSGELIQVAPYARYQYYGRLMVDPVYHVGGFYDRKTGRWWSRPRVTKIMDPQGRSLNYNRSRNPKAGAHWFERMAAENKAAIGRGAAEIAGGKYSE